MKNLSEYAFKTKKIQKLQNNIMEIELDCSEILIEEQKSIDETINQIRMNPDEETKIAHKELDEAAAEGSRFHQYSSDNPRIKQDDIFSNEEAKVFSLNQNQGTGSQSTKKKGGRKAIADSEIRDSIFEESSI